MNPLLGPCQTLWRVQGSVWPRGGEGRVETWYYFTANGLTLPTLTNVEWFNFYSIERLGWLRKADCTGLPTAFPEARLPVGLLAKAH